MKPRPLWSDRCQQAAALLCGLIFLLCTGSAGAATTPPRKAAVNAPKKVKLQSARQGKGKSKSPARVSRKTRDKKPPLVHSPADSTIGMAEMRPEEDIGLRGAASFYGQGFQGRRSATGERFDARAFTAASNHFPLGSWVAVQRLDNERCAIVRVNDRMNARHTRRVIDVSRSVASYLDMIRSGVVLVRVNALKSADRAAGHCRAAFESADACPDCPVPPLSEPRLTTERDFPLP